MADATSAADRALIRGLLGPGALADRVHDLEQARAHAVDDSAARLRAIERDLHDGAQAQLVGLAMSWAWLTTSSPVARTARWSPPIWTGLPSW